MVEVLATSQLSADRRSWLSPAHWTWWARVCATLPCPPGNQAQLQNPTSSEGKDDDSPKNHSEQQRYGQRQATMEGQEVQLDALQVLQDEDQDHQQGHDAHDQRSPGPAESGLLLARIGSTRRCLWRRRSVHRFSLTLTAEPSQAGCNQGEGHTARTRARRVRRWRGPSPSPSSTTPYRGAGRRRASAVPPPDRGSRSPRALPYRAETSSPEAPLHATRQERSTPELGCDGAHCG